MYRRVHGEEQRSVACAPFKTRRSCRLVPGPPGSPGLLEVDVVDTVPTQHCANHEGAPRADVKSVLLAPASSSSAPRVAIESVVVAPSTTTMSAGVVDGVATLEATASLGDGADAYQALVFRTDGTSCALVFTLCDHAMTSCTEPVELWSPHALDERRCALSTVPKVAFARESDTLRVTVGEPPGETKLFSLPRERARQLL
jgi:hypothetical protein